jgi:disulfide bond formation protein DsbB
MITQLITDYLGVFLAYGTLGIQLAILVGAVFYLAERFLGFQPDYYLKVKDILSHYYRELALGLATAATVGSLMFSNILGYEPCQLCWFQRILMYPLILIIGVGLLFNDKNMRDYALPLTMIGVPLSFYHSILQRYEQFQSAGCSITSVSCETQYTFYFDYITIPVMAFTAFLGVAILLWRFSDREYL